MALGIDATIRNNMLDEITAVAGINAVIEIYSGTRPATGGAETTVLATLAGDATAFAAAATGGVLTLNTIVDDSSADSTGTASWFRIYASNGTTHVLDGDVSTSASDLNLNSVSITILGTVSITSFTITAGNP